MLTVKQVFFSRSTDWKNTVVMWFRLWEYLCRTTEWQTAVVKWRRRILRRGRRTGKIGWGQVFICWWQVPHKRRKMRRPHLTYYHILGCGAYFHLLVAKEFENKKTSNKSLFFNRKTLHLHNVRCGGVPLGQLLREAEASAVAN